MDDNGNIPSKPKIIYANDIINNYYTTTEFDKEIIKHLPLISIGGKIFYDAGDNGATYIFYDSSGNIINDTSISGLQSAINYKKLGSSTKDRFYVVYPNMLYNGNKVYWGFYYNVDIKESGGNILDTKTEIGTGKKNTRTILDYISVYASSETASTNKPSSDISQYSHNGYNLYKNCGTDSSYLWDIIKDVNKYSLRGYNDWFIPSKDELYQIATSSVISDITSSNYIWSSSAYSSSLYAHGWSSYFKAMYHSSRDGNGGCLVCRAF